MSTPDDTGRCRGRRVPLAWPTRVWARPLTFLSGRLSCCRSHDVAVGAGACSVEHMANTAGSHRLSGVRLGRMERALLLRAPSAEAMYGYMIDEPDRSVREQLRRATRKLEGIGLIEVMRLDTYIHVRDPRRAQLQFSGTGFWRYPAPTRRHAVKRNVVWLSPFGEEIVSRYRTYLRSGRALRWDAREIQMAERAADRWSSPRRREIRRDAFAEHDAANGSAELTRSGTAERIAVTPDGAETAEGAQRWALSIAIANTREPSASADSLFEASVVLFEQQTMDELGALASSVGAVARRARTTRAAQYRARRRSQLPQY